MTRRLPSSVAAAIAFLTLMTSTSGLAQDAERGRRLAEIHCTSCHSTDRTAGRETVARSFRTIAEDPFLDADLLRGALAAPHPPMPDPTLGDDEIRDLVAYIISLGPG